MIGTSYFSSLRVFLFGSRRRWVRPRVWRRLQSRLLARNKRCGVNSTSTSNHWAGFFSRPRHTSPLSSSFTLEPLEPRVLLAADLSGLVTAHSLQDPSVPTNAESATVQVQNIGNQRANATTQVAVYASLDTTLDGSDVLLGTSNTNALNAGQSRNVNVNLAMPNTLAPGTYHLLTRVDNTNVIAEGTAGEANNIMTGPSFGVVWQFGAVPGRAGNTNLTLRDADGTVVTFSLSGP